MTVQGTRTSKNPSLTGEAFAGGPSRIRTYEGVSQQIYSLPRLTASVSTHGAENGTRTHDLRFTKPLLYQLSYIGFYSGVYSTIHFPEKNSNHLLY